MKWLKHLASTVFVVVALAIILPLAIPLDSYLPEIEKLASAQLREPVRVGGLRAALLPLPHVHLKKISIGKNADVRIASCNINLNVYSLFDPAKMVNSVTLKDIVITTPALAKLPAWLTLGSGAQAVQLKKIRLDNLILVLQKISLGPFDGSVQFTPQNDFKNALFASQDGKLRLVLTPRQKNYRLEISARQWQPLLGPKFLFDTLSVSALLTQTGLRAQAIQGELYGGQISGTSDMDWDKDWRLSGTLTTQGMQMQPLIALFGSKRNMSGSLDADATYSMRGADAAQLFDDPRINAKFRIQKGVLYKMDLAKAAQTLAKEGVHGGETRFDEFTGNLEVTNKEYRFKDLKITSGLLNGKGNVDIKPDKQLDGRVKIAVKVGITLVEVPLDVAGTVDDPTLSVPPAIIAGAVAGTALLGPGLGTGLGMKAGEAAEKIKSWFNRDASEEPAPPKKE